MAPQDPTGLRHRSASLCVRVRGAAGQLGRSAARRRYARPTGFSVSTFPSQASPTSFPTGPARPPSPGSRTSAGSRPLPAPGPKGGEFLWVPGVPRVQRDGKLQKSSALCPPPRLSRNSRPWARAPQLIHSPARGRPSTSTLASAAAAPPTTRLGSARGALRPGVSTRPPASIPSARPAAGRHLRARGPPPSVAFPTDGLGRRGGKIGHLCRPFPRDPELSRLLHCSAPPRPGVCFGSGFAVLGDGALRGPCPWTPAWCVSLEC